MGDWHLRLMSIAEHKIELLLNMDPVNLVPYQTDLTIWEFQRLKIEEMLSQTDIEPTQTERVVLSVLALK